MLCMMFDDRKYMYIYLPIYQEYCVILENKKWVGIFPHQLVNTCDLHLVMSFPDCVLALNCNWLNHTTWLGAAILFACSSRYNHSRCPRAWHLSQYHFLFFYTIQTPICYVGCLMIANTWTYISLKHQEYSYLGKEKISLYFSTSNCEHLWPSPF